MLACYQLAKFGNDMNLYIQSSNFTVYEKSHMG